MNTADIIKIMVLPYLVEEEDIAVYGPYLAALAKMEQEEKEVKNNWFTCRKCLVQWRIQANRSNCFACGKFGTRGLYVK